MTTGPMFDASGTFRVDVVHLDGHAVLQLHGDLDLATVELLAAAVRGVQAQGTPELVLDLSSLNFVDSYGLRELVVARKRQQEIGGDVILLSPTKRTLRTLEIVGLTQVFTIA